MTQIARALRDFFGGFGLPAYPEGGVPVDADGDCPASRMPYITYEVVAPAFGETMSLQARVYAWSSGYGEVLAAAGEIAERVGSGVLLPAGPGSVCLRQGSPLVQLAPSEERLLKTACVNLLISGYTG